MSDVFISYSRSNVDFAEQLFDALKSRGMSAWVDWQNIPRSAGWWDEIERGIDAATTFIFLLSNDSLGSAVCTLELAHAHANGKRIIPVIIQSPDFDAPIPVRPQDALFQQMLGGRDLFALARELRTLLRERNWVQFIDKDGAPRLFDDALVELLDTLNTDLEHSYRHARLLVRAREWENGKRDDDLLLIGDEITQAEVWLVEAEARGKEPTPTDLHRQYITTSRRVEDARLRRLRNIRRASVLASLVAVVAIVFALVFSLIGVQATNSANVAHTDVAQANDQLTAVPPTLTLVNQQVLDAQFQADAAQEREATATRQIATSVAVQGTEQARANAAGTQVSELQATATQIPPILTQAAILRQEAQNDRFIASEFAAAILNKANTPNQLIERMDRLVEQFPDYASAYHVRGLAYHNLGDYRRAVLDYTLALIYDPFSDSIYVNRGLAYRALNEYEKAVADYNRAIEINPESVHAYNDLGAVYNWIGEYEKALAAYDQAISLDSSDAATYNNRGLTYSNIEKLEEAVSDFSHAIELDPDFDSAYHNRGIAYSKLGNSEQAISDYNHAVALNPSDAAVYYNRGLEYDNQNRYDLALADYDQAIALDPTLVLAYQHRGQLNAYLGEYDRAIEDFDQVLVLDPTVIEGLLQRGLVYGSLHEFERAIKDFDQVLILAPLDFKALTYRGLAYGSLNRHERAIEDFDQAIELAPDYAFAYYNRGLSYAYLGDYVHAISDFDHAIDVDSGYILAYYNRGVSYFLLGNGQSDSVIQVQYYQQALADWQQAETLGHVLPVNIKDIMIQIEAMLSGLTPTPGQ
ncbi:MAG: tetratricopeptide repeat protein [Anaerolineaceae bacterium]|nr:tetratricopeptide repeat protein [Anaerolineaceae bacterium]